MKKIIRIILSPFVFVFLVLAMTLFPGPISLIMGISILVGNAFKDNNDLDDPISETLFMTFFWVTYPFVAAKSFIKDGTIPE